jgi:DNA-binding CsgD family transcriptional regulator
MDFVGRSEELDQLQAALAAAAAGEGRFVLVQGESGVGKTTLVRTFIASVEARSTILYGACEDWLTPWPLQPFSSMVAGEPELRSALESEDTIAFSAQLLSWLESGGAVVVDDAQWADQATLEVLRYVGRRISATSGLVVVIVRDEDMSREHPLRRVVGSIPPAVTIRVHLKPLDIAAVRELAQQSDVDALYSKTNGIPLLVAELLRSDAEVPAAIEDRVLARVQRLSEPARSAVEFASVVPGSCDLDLLKRCVDVDVETLDECERSGLITVTPTEVGFRHELVRMAVERSLGAGRRISLNAAVLAALRSSGVEPARLLHHAVLAGDTDAVISLTPEAVRRAIARGGNRQALDHLAVLEPHLDGLTSTHHGDVLELWSEAAYATGAIATALARRRAAVELRREDGDELALGRSLRRISLLYWQMKQPKRAKESAAEAVAILRSTSSVDEYVRALADQAFIHVMHHEHDEAASIGEVAEAAAADLDDASLNGYLLAVRCWYEPKPDWISTACRAVDIGLKLGDTATVARAFYLLVQHAPDMSLDRRDSVLAEADRFARDYGQDFLRAFILVARSQIAAGRGRFGEAEDQARLAAEIWDDTDQNLAVGPLVEIGLNQSRRGAPQAAETLRTVADIAKVRSETTRYVHGSLAEPYWLHGGDFFDAAVATADFELIRRTGTLDGRDAWDCIWLNKLGLIEPPHELADTPEGLLMAGDWRGAADAWTEDDAPYKRAIALSSGGIDDRIEAVRICDTLGAAPMARRLREDLHAEGVTGIPRGPQRSTLSNPVGLTKRQVEVLELLQQGRTNNEIADELFISPRTVEHHVAAVLSKLELNSRIEVVLSATTAESPE